ncbi:hypothetical protein FRC02_011528 [Tulasnella sp. 418]|nr:hypothetical protein FRC02_011528 [Tulasnella sp. 418]
MGDNLALQNAHAESPPYIPPRQSAGGSNRNDETNGAVRFLNGAGRNERPVPARPFTWMDTSSAASMGQESFGTPMNTSKGSNRLSTNPFLRRIWEEKLKKNPFPTWKTKKTQQTDSISQSDVNVRELLEQNNELGLSALELGDADFTSLVQVVSCAEQSRRKRRDLETDKRSSLRRSSAALSQVFPALTADSSSTDVVSRSTVRPEAKLNPSASSSPQVATAVDSQRCSNCKRVCILSRNPLADHQNFKVPDRVFGLRLPCPLGHIYCITCMRTIINALTRKSKEQSRSAFDCYQCTTHGHFDWKMPLDILDTVFTPQESSKLRQKLSSHDNPKADLASAHSPSITVTQAHQDESNPVVSATSTEVPASKCGICMEPFHSVTQPVKRPSSKARYKTPKDQLLDGLVLPCPGSHEYCVICIARHVEEELGKGSEVKTVFPIRCPECPQGSWSITNDIAEIILSSALLERWHLQKLRDSIVKIHCPYPQCSALVEVPSPERLRDAACPACYGMICVRCRAPWHTALTCTEYIERNMAEQLMYDLAKRSGWRRCPQCKIIVERSTGCPHMSCRCGHHFCYRCGSDYVDGSCQQGTECRERPDPSFSTNENASPAPRVSNRNTSTQSSGVLRSSPNPVFRSNTARRDSVEQLTVPSEDHGYLHSTRPLSTAERSSASHRLVKSPIRRAPQSSFKEPQSRRQSTPISFLSLWSGR